jgi:hypothetical protein
VTQRRQARACYRQGLLAAVIAWPVLFLISQEGLDSLTAIYAAVAAVIMGIAWAQLLATQGSTQSIWPLVSVVILATLILPAVVILDAFWISPAVGMPLLLILFWSTLVLLVYRIAERRVVNEHARQVLVAAGLGLATFAGLGLTVANVKKPLDATFTAGWDCPGDKYPLVTPMVDVPAVVTYPRTHAMAESKDTLVTDALGIVHYQAPRYGQQPSVWIRWTNQVQGAARPSQSIAGDYVRVMTTSLTLGALPTDSGMHPEIDVTGCPP